MRAVLLSRLTGCKRARIAVTHSIEVGPAGEAVWTIGNYSGIPLDHVGKIASPNIELGDQICGFWLHPNGDTKKKCLALYLHVPNAENLSGGWSRKVQMILEVRNQLTRAKTVGGLIGLVM
jgi:hypothetical protein